MKCDCVLENLSLDRSALLFAKHYLNSYFHATVCPDAIPELNNKQELLTREAGWVEGWGL